MALSNTQILEDFLEFLLQRWSPSRIYLALDKLVPESEKPSRYRRKRPSKKRVVFPDAVDQVDRLSVPKEQKILLTEIAEAYDKKKFLPSIADVNNFAKMRGLNLAKINSRAKAFDAILPTLVDLPNNSLTRTFKSGMRSGPARLGPIAEAITGPSSHQSEINRFRENEKQFKRR